MCFVHKEKVQNYFINYSLIHHVSTCTRTQIWSRRKLRILTDEHTCNLASCTKIGLLRQIIPMYQIYTSHICFVPKKKLKLYCIN